DIVILGLCFGLSRIIHLRRHHATRTGFSSLTAVIGVLAVAVLMNEWPYRIMFAPWNMFERIDFAGACCYVIGVRAADWLIYCPDRNPPRNRVIRRTDPAVRRAGVVESIFTPLAASR